MALDEAAAALGISREAVRLRIRRGTLPGERIGGHWYVRGLVGRSEPGTVVLPPSATDRPARPARAPRRDELVAELRDRVAFLERLVEHQAGVIAQQSASLAGLAQRPALPKPHTEPTPETAPEAVLPMQESRQDAATPPVRRGWLARLFRG